MMKYRIILAIPLLHSTYSHATTWSVGPARIYTYCSQVAPLVQDGDTIRIDAATYVNDPQVQWNKNNLYITGVGGRPRLQAGSIIANDMVNGKGIFVTRGANIHIHNIEFANAVVQDNNGAGIRQEGANLLVTSCVFDRNEMGILGGNIPNCKTTVEHCEFKNGGSSANPGFQHNIYINHIDTLVFRYNYSHDAIAEGHEVKSRANYNFILYNRIANEQSEDSRTIDLPNGGTSVVVGNIIEQGQNSANSNLLGYGQEGLSNPAPHRIYVCSNTFINKKTTGNFIQVANSTEILFVKNNIFAGARTGGLITGMPMVLDSSNNVVNTNLNSFGFINEAGYDYHLLSSSVVIDAGIIISGTINGYSLHPDLMYLDTCQFEPRIMNGLIDLGAFEYEAPVRTEENEKQTFRIFPNPVSTTLYVQVKHSLLPEATIRISDISGKELLIRQFPGIEESIDVTEWIKGIYFITIRAGNGISVQKFIVH